MGLGDRRARLAALLRSCWAREVAGDPGAAELVGPGGCLKARGCGARGIRRPGTVALPGLEGRLSPGGCGSAGRRLWGPAGSEGRVCGARAADGPGGAVPASREQALPPSPQGRVLRGSGPSERPAPVPLVQGRSRPDACPCGAAEPTSRDSCRLRVGEHGEQLRRQEKNVNSERCGGQEGMVQTRYTQHTVRHSVVVFMGVLLSSVALKGVLRKAIIWCFTWKAESVNTAVALPLP